jgi:hypothetical protein
MRRRSGFLAAAALAVFALAPTLSESEPLTRQQLLSMKAAGMGDKVIVQAVDANGIAFPADANTLIALRKAGFSDSVISALITAQSSRQPPVATTAGAPAVSKSQNGVGQVTGVDQCDIDKREDDRLENRIKMFSDACQRVGEMRYPGRSGIGTDAYSFAEHCTHLYVCPLIKQEREQKQKIRDCEGVDVTDYHIEDCEANFVPTTVPLPTDALQVLQAGDSSMTCADLKIETDYLNVGIGTLNGKIQAATGNAQTHSQNAQTANAVASTAPRLAPGLIVMGSSEGNQSATDSQKAARYQQIRDNFQKRHDYLMQMYFQKHCHE